MKLGARNSQAPNLVERDRIQLTAHPQLMLLEIKLQRHLYLPWAADGVGNNAEA